MQERTEVITRAPTTTEVVTTPAPTTAVDEVHATAYDPYENRRRASYRMVQAIWLVFGLIEALLLIRFVLRALGANQQADFARFIYNLSSGFVAPFANLFGTPQVGGAALEFTTLVAMIVYAIVAWFLAKLAWLLVGETRSATTTSANTVRTHVR